MTIAAPMTTVRDRSGFAAAAGFLTALYLVAGRSKLDRLFLGGIEGPIAEVRVWVVVAFLVVLFWPRWRSDEAPWFRPVAGGSMIGISVLLCWVLASAFWGKNAELAMNKAYEIFLVLSVTLLLFASLSSGDVESVLLWFWRSFFALASVLAVAAVPVLMSGGFDRLAVLGGGPNVFGRLMGLWGIAGLYLSRRDHAYFALAFPTSWLLVILSGSRGAMIASTLALLVYLVAERVSLRTILTGLIATAVVATLVFTLTPIGKLAVAIYQQRFVALTLVERHTAGRDNLYRFGYELALQAPVFGNGLAGFAATGYDLYPHNFFLELFCETGIVGLVLGFLVFAPPAGAIRRIDSGMFAGLTLITVACQFSGDLFDSRGIFVFILLAMASATLRRPKGGWLARFGRAGTPASPTTNPS